MKKIKITCIAVLMTAVVLSASQVSDDNVFEGLSLHDIFSIELTSGSFLELDLSRSPLSMTIITSDQLSVSGARTMSEALEIFVPGFQYMFNKWNGTLWGMRGVALDRNTKIIYLVNGHKMNTQARDGFLSETVLGFLNDIERIEVLRGPAGLVYGSGAIAGIINVVTKKAEDSDNTIMISGNTIGTQNFQANLHSVTESGTNISFFAGFKRSDGLPAHASTIYGKASWPYPNWIATEKDGVPSDGNYGATDGNWMVSGDVSNDAFEFYFRYTRQKENAGGWFILDPWPEIMGAPPEDAPSREVNGRMVEPTDPFWSQTESWRTNRRQYFTENITSQASYNLDMGANELQFKAGFDVNTTRIGTERRLGYESDYYSSREGYIDETFGERRLTLGTMFLLRQVHNLQLASGLEYRLDMVGNDKYGLNEKAQNSKHPIVSEINYNTISAFYEGFYDVTDWFGLHHGLRFDAHTRATMINPKFAAIYNPSYDHSIKLIYQTASNNGSVDNYEYNRWHFYEDGQVRSDISFERPYEPPGVTTDILPPIPDESILHDLRPEKVRSLELAYVGNVDALTLAPSMSMNWATDLFGWSQTLFRVVDAGSYSYFNLDLDVRYETGMFDLGVNHTFQRPVRTSVNEQSFEFELPHVNKDSAGWYDSIQVDGRWHYYPVAVEGKYDTIEVNNVRDGITADGQHFLNLSTNVTKAFVTFTPTNWLTLHSNLRLFWGLRGRESLYAEDEGFNYWDFEKGRDEDQSFKDYFMRRVAKRLNASIHVNLSNGYHISLYGYDLLGVDNDLNAINTLRWQQMAEPEQRALYATDQRTFGLSLTKTF
ncbi:TonB-dependent receptor plug domain-containing protein [Chitinispirillales bacterium ANBcel5]|uniref:TonB-dependent receptor plug domain-containing protein n=1 Tax=Cellulosispirillum alkaliphilum TaxID=3039283 RepID=UPI002A5763B6|nr:TonB-dependent receptor plug domain-containing protein [Chitinispirillales bacterium ANBcel5]